MSTQVENGKAFEWAFAQALAEYLNIPLEKSSAMDFNKSCFENSISASLKARFQLNSKLMVSHIIERESANLMLHDAVTVRVLPDSSGKSGDVRDVVLVAKNGSIGFSCKTNHDAFKHSRLSGSLDFVNKWGIDSKGCSHEYWAAIKPIFDELKRIRIDSNREARWDEIPDKDEKVYSPLLQAFSVELSKVLSSSEHACESLIKYIIGTHDFYKVISKTGYVEVQEFNFGGSLAGVHTKYPTKLIAIDADDGGRFSKTLRFNGGFTFNFRIHNAESKVTPSLKFDIRALSLPPNGIYTHHIRATE